MIRVQVIIVVSVVQMRLEELLNGVRVPFVDRQRFGYVPVVIDHLDDRIQTSHVLDLQIRELGRPVALHERLDLRIGSELAGANLEDGARILLGHSGYSVLLAALGAVFPKDIKWIRHFLIQGSLTHFNSSSPNVDSFSHDEQTSVDLMKPNSWQSCDENSDVACDVKPDIRLQLQATH